MLENLYCQTFDFFLKFTRLTFCLKSTILPRMAPIEVEFEPSWASWRVEHNRRSTDTLRTDEGQTYFYPPGENPPEVTIFVKCNRDDRGGEIEVRDSFVAQIGPSKVEKFMFQREKIRQSEEKRVVRGGKTILTARHVPRK